MVEDLFPQSQTTKVYIASLRCSGRTADSPGIGQTTGFQRRCEGSTYDASVSSFMVFRIILGLMPLKMPVTPSAMSDSFFRYLLLDGSSLYFRLTIRRRTQTMSIKPYLLLRSSLCRRFSHSVALWTLFYFSLHGLGSCSLEKPQCGLQTQRCLGPSILLKSIEPVRII